MSRYLQMSGLSQRDASVLGRFGAFCALEGVAPELGDPDLIETFLAIGCPDLAPHSLGTYRSVLVRLGRCSYRAGRAFGASAAPAPYRVTEVAALWSMAKSQSSTGRVRRAKVLLSSMLGAGLRPGELAALDAAAVSGDARGVVVEVGGSPGRTVPVRDRYAEELAALAQSSSGYLFRPGARVRNAKNLIGEVCAALVHDPDEVALVSGRARSTFICWHLGAGTALDQLCAMAGLKGVESLLRYARHVPGAPRSKAQLRAALRQ
jgi:integrase